MTAVSLGTATAHTFNRRRSFSWHDLDIDCTLVVSQPSADPRLWREYSLGAQRSYRNHGVECALDMDALNRGDDTIMFFAVIDNAGKMVAGVRAIELRSADDSHAVVEWEGQPGQQLSAT
jgi:hypothetical protein